MFILEDEARLIYQKAEDDYYSKFNNGLPILTFLCVRTIDNVIALKILDLVEKAIEDNKPLGNYDNKIY